MFWHLVNVRFPLQDTLTAAGPLPCSTRSREPLTTMLRSSFWSVSTTTREQSGTAAPSSTLSRVQHGTVPFAKRHVDLFFSQLLVLLTEITQYPLAHSLSLAKDVLQHRRKSRFVASILLLNWLFSGIGGNLGRGNFVTRAAIPSDCVNISCRLTLPVPCGKLHKQPTGDKSCKEIVWSFNTLHHRINCTDILAINIDILTTALIISSNISVQFTTTLI